MSLYAQLRTAVEDRRRLAQEATPGSWVVFADPLGPGYGDMYWIRSVTYGAVTQDMSEGGVAVERTGDEGGRADADHIAANHPDRILRDCDRDLKVLERHRLYTDRTSHAFCEPDCKGGDCAWCHIDCPCPDIRDLAEAYGVEVTS